MLKAINKNDLPVYIFYFIITFCKSIDLTSDSKIYLILYVFGVLFLLFKLYNQSYSLMEIIIMISLLILCLIIFYTAKNNSPLFLIIAIFSLKNVNFKNVLKLVFITHLILFITMIMLSSGGLIDNKYFLHLRNSNSLVRRYSFGYQHPNLVQAHLLSIIILYYYIYGEKSNLLIHAFWILLSIILYKYTFSRTSFALSIVFIFYYMFLKKNRILKKCLAVLGEYSFIILSIITFIMAYNYNSSILIRNIDTFLTGRFYYLNIIMNNYSISLFGQSDFGKNVAIDNSYFGLLYQCGIILFFIICISNFWTLHKFYKEKKYDILIYVLFLNIFCFTENFYIIPIINFMSLIIYGNLIFRKEGAIDESNNFNSNI